MTIAETLLLDFDAEAENTRRVLERIPTDKADWKPHGKSMALGAMAAHVAGLAAFGHIILTTPQMDMAKDKFPHHDFVDAEELIRYAAGAGGEARTALAGLSDEALLEEWSLLFDGQLIRKASRAVCYRTMFFNHLVHHRGQLCVYLRLLDIPVPGIFGPSADEPFGG